ncbi:MAG: hypothetical protein L3J04_11360 [Robiginitomaculum sp.]|nr:hypothetical protein [Robiginitomaculum sp.]
MKNKFRIKWHLSQRLAFLFLVIFFSGCASVQKNEPKKLGSSVRAMIKAQIYDRSTIKNPPLDVVEGMDSKKAIGNLRETYRKTMANKQQTKEIKLQGKE